MFDSAEGYAEGNSEVEMGRVIKECGWQRSDLIITTKIFFGTGRKDFNSRGLSRKHLIEGLNHSLARLEMEYVRRVCSLLGDAILIFCVRTGRRRLCPPS